MAQTWIFPDVHGYVKTLRMLFLQIRPSKEDHLIFLGDYIDRGPDAKGVIDFVMELQQEGYQIDALKGNHESYMIETYRVELTRRKGLFAGKNSQKEAWFEHGGRETLASFHQKDLRKVPPEYIRWMDERPLYLILDGYVIVHAGLNFKIDNPFDDTFAMLWVKDFEIIPEKIDHRILIHGHTPVSHEFILETLENDQFGFIDLDNGVYMKGREGFGNLMALELHSRQLVVQPAIDDD
jgi:serine/threonine protein phosphatase 1